MVQDKLPILLQKRQITNIRVNSSSFETTQAQLYLLFSETMATQAVQPSDVAALSPEYAELTIDANRLMSTLEKSCSWG